MKKTIYNSCAILAHLLNRKKINFSVKILFLFLLLQSFQFTHPQKTTAQVSVSFQLFYDALSPHGSWINNAEYGYVWRPRVGLGFMPYDTNGYWTYTESGWAWVSDYSWGWAPFHYGRWLNDRFYGWLWVPDNEWGPGWVTWRMSTDYYGWAPIGPGISLEFAYSNRYNVPDNHWRFVRDRDFGKRDLFRYYVDKSERKRIFNNSSIINNIREDRSQNSRYNVGPDRSDVERRVGRTFSPITIKESDRPGQKIQDNRFEIYRPRIQKNNPSEQRPAPTRVITPRNERLKVERQQSSNKPPPNKPPGRAPRKNKE